MSSTLLFAVLLGLHASSGAADSEACAGEFETDEGSFIQAQVLKTKTIATEVVQYPQRRLAQRRSPTAESREVACGTPESNTECPLDYSMASVDALASKSWSEKDANSKALEDIHSKARQACIASADKSDTILEHGGWCYGSQDAALVEASGGKTDIDYLRPPHHVEADETIVSVLAKQVLPRGNGSAYSLSDLGAGVGQFGHALRAQLPELEYHGYDGAGNVEEFTKGYVNFADLTLPLSLKRTDWVLSSEVGEHIPHQDEAQVIANLHAHNCRGIILTWAVVGQKGTSHVNCHSNEYLIKVFEGLGYKQNVELTSALRANHSLPWPLSSEWLAHSALAFERVAKPAGCV